MYRIAVILYENLDILGPEPKPKMAKSSNMTCDGDSGVFSANGDSKLNDCHSGTPFIQQDKEVEIPSGMFKTSIFTFNADLTSKSN